MTALIGPVEAPDLHVMSFNIRRPVAFDPRSADSWDRRRDRAAVLVTTEGPTILGLQEVMPQQAAFLRIALGDRYRSVGRGRDADGNGEACPILYDTERVELVEHHQRALSTRPGVPGTRSWGSFFPRVAVIAAFVDRATSATFTVINTHLDPFSPRARVRSAELLRTWSSQSPHPSIVMGDLNAGARSPALRALLSGGDLRDAWRGAETRITPEWGTFANYRRPRRGTGRIDWIAVSPDVRVRSTGINGAVIDGGWASDHLPIHAVVRLNEKGIGR